MKLIRHLHNVNIHRFYVFKLCCKVGIPFQGLTHDLSKYSLSELIPSVKYFTDGKKSPLAEEKNIKGYSLAWLHHKGRNKHHFEYWYDYDARVKTPIIPFKYMHLRYIIKIIIITIELLNTLIVKKIKLKWIRD